jgi:hypothetical protein
MKRLPLWLTLIAQAQVLVYLAIVGVLDARGSREVDGGWLALTGVAIGLLLAGGLAQLVLLPWCWWWRPRMELGMLPLLLLSAIGAAYALAVGVFLIAATGLAGA